MDASDLAYWESISKILAAILLPVGLAVIGHVVTRAVKEREIQGKFVELALSILKEPPSEEQRNLRLWATRIIDRYSGVPLSTEATEDLVTRVPLTMEVLNLRNVERKYSVPAESRAIDQVIISDSQHADLKATTDALEDPRLAGVYHYLINRDGSRFRLVDEANVAHHTAGHNNDSIGIGLVHRSGEGAYPGAQLAALIDLLVDIGTRHGIPVDRMRPKSEVQPQKRSDLAPIFAGIRDAVDARLREDQ